MDVLRLTSTQVTVFTLSLFLIAKNGAAIQCFQCDSTSERTCAEALPLHHVLYANSCDHVQEAQYCVKMTGVFEGELGTKRFCSARDWGNYCEWVRRPGDEREYRACVFTCWGDSCNGGSIAGRNAALLPLLFFLLFLYHRAWP